MSRVLALAALDGLAELAFAAAYGAGAPRLLRQGAFLIALAVVFGAAAAIWVRTKRAAARRGDAIARIGRIAVALLAAVVVGPVAVLMPLFALQAQLPPEAGLDHVIARTMVVLLAAAALVALVNLAGGCVIAASALVRRLRSGPRLQP